MFINAGSLPSDSLRDRIDMTEDFICFWARMWWHHVKSCWKFIGFINIRHSYVNLHWNNFYSSQLFHVAYVLIKFANSPRPDLWVLEHSIDFGKTYKPWKFFACEYNWNEHFIIVLKCYVLKTTLWRVCGLQWWEWKCGLSEKGQVWPVLSVLWHSCLQHTYIEFTKGHRYCRWQHNPGNNN